MLASHLLALLHPALVAAAGRVIAAAALVGSLEGIGRAPSSGLLYSARQREIRKKIKSSQVK